MEIALVKAADPGDHDRAYLKGGDVARRGPIHVVHDLPHLVVESLFDVTDGLWGELASGLHAAVGHAASARDPKPPEAGGGSSPGRRPVAGLASGSRRDTAGPRRSPTA
jgi:hypothetical protein